MLIQSGWLCGVDGYGWLFRVDGDSQWMVIPSGWLFRKDDNSEWTVFPNAWLFRMDGFSEWMVSPRGHYFAFLVQPARTPELPSGPATESRRIELLQNFSNKQNVTQYVLE